MPDALVISATTQQCLKQGANPSFAFAILGNETQGGNQTYPSGPKQGQVEIGTAGEVGAFQVKPSTAEGLHLDPNTLYGIDGNATAGVKLIKQLTDVYPNNPAAVLAAYNQGQPAVDAAMSAVGDTTRSGTAFLNAPAGAGNTKWNPNIAQAYVKKALPMASGKSASDFLGNLGVSPVSKEVGPVAGLVRDPVAQQVVAMKKPTVNFNDLFPDVIINTGLKEVPWYKDTGLVTGNPKVRGSVTPVVFEVVLKGRDNEILSESPTSDTGSAYRPGNPIQVQLNASMKTFSVSSKHVFHPQRTRTAWHITMWGMQADTIEGSCTTGVFMNQFGLTDWFSTAQADDRLIKLVTGGFQTLASNQPTLAQSIAGASPDMVTENYYPDSTSQFNSYIKNTLKVPDPSEAFRVAAQDAFVEFLSLFKNNGVVWFNSQEALGGNEQVGVDQWSPELGMAATNRNARNNDVMSRGSILMKFKGTSYMGYFKSLSWSQDASKPFSWDFNFVFQVEKTLGYIFPPIG